VTVEIRPATAADSPGIRRLFARAFGAEMTAEEWEWKYVQCPDGWFGIVAADGGDILGSYPGWGMRFLLEGRERLVYSVGDVSTDPSARMLGGKRGIFRRMTEAFYEAVFARGIPFCFGFPGERHRVVSRRLVGTRTLFPIREVLVPCDSFPLPPRGGAAADYVGAEFDGLWEAASRHLGWAAVRDRYRANWRFHARPARYYRMVWDEQAGRMQSWGVLSVAGETALVADYLGREPDGGDLPALFAVAAAEARRMGAKTLVFWETPGGPGSAVIRGLDGERRDAGFPLDARSSDHALADRFGTGLHLTPALYDMV
jgi:hypothetical protein